MPLRRAFGRPVGLLGRLGGRVMARGNGPTENHVAALAELRAGETVAVIGPGPGVGVVAAAAAARVLAVDPSSTMLNACRRRCRRLVRDGILDLELHQGTAETTGLAPAVADVVISVNNVMLWQDRRAGLAELFRLLRPGGRLLISAHAKWLPGGLDRLAADTDAAGFAEVTTWTWQPPTRAAATAAQLRAIRPA